MVEWMMKAFWMIHAFSGPRWDAIVWFAAYRTSCKENNFPDSLLSGKLKSKVPDRRIASVKDEYMISAVPPWIHENALVRSARYNHISGKWRLPETSQNTLWSLTFDCALRGPFDSLFLTWLSASQALCKGMTAVISASTVYVMKFLSIIRPIWSAVKPQEYFWWNF